MAAAKSHPVWKAVGLVVAGYIVLRLISAYLQERDAAALANSFHFVGGGGGSGYSVVPSGTAPVKKPNPKPPATGKPKKPKKSPSGKGPGSKRFGDFVPVDNPNLYLGLIGRTGPLQYRGGAN